MRLWFLVVLLLVAVSTPAWADNCSQAEPESDSCKIATSITRGENQAYDNPIDKEAVKCAEKNTDNAGTASCVKVAVEKYEQALDLIYKDALASVNEETGKALRQSHDEWLRFYEKETVAKQLAALGGGSMMGAKLLSEQKRLLKQRIAQLSFYLQWGRKE